MAKAKITGDIPGIGRIEVDGNIATEETLEELVNAINRQQSSLKTNTDKFNKEVDDAASGLDEFSDELERAEKMQDRVNQSMIDLVDQSQSVITGFARTARSTGSLSDMVESAGDIVSGLAGGLGGMIPLIGEGTARLAEAASQAAFALLGMAVGAIESFQSLNRSIMDSGMLLDGGFTGFSNAAREAGLPITVFGEAVLASTNRLRLMSGGQPGGLARLASGIRELNEASSENMAELYALGFTASEVTAGMANVAIAADRAGQNLSSEELAAGTYDYLRNLRELTRLTGISTEEAMAQVEANRANLFVQNQLAALGPEQRAAAEDFVAAMERSGLGPLADFAMTGQYLNQETALMATRMGPLADIMRQYFLDLESGVDPETAMARFNQQVAINEDAINTAIQENARTFGLTRELAEQFGFLGEGGLAIQRMLEAVEQGTDPLASTGENAENLSITMGEFQQALFDSQAALQNQFVGVLNSLSGDDGALTAFARSISGVAGVVDDFGTVLNHVIRGDYEAAAAAMGLNSDEATTALQRAGEVAQTPIPTGTDPAVAAIIEQMQQDLVQLRANELFGDRSPLVGTLQERLDQQRQQLIDLLGPESARELLQTMGLPEAAAGNILTGPESGYTAELHGTEAVVPLPDGRSIPVSLQTGGLNAIIADALSTETTAEDTVVPTVQNFAASLDNSRSLPELVNISRNMLGQMTASTQKLEQMIRAMEQGNNINRNAAYARA